MYLGTFGWSRACFEPNADRNRLNEGESKSCGSPLFNVQLLPNVNEGSPQPDLRSGRELIKAQNCSEIACDALEQQYVRWNLQAFYFSWTPSFTFMFCLLCNDDSGKAPVASKVTNFN
jgi:hypothetical protein